MNKLLIALIAITLFSCTKEVRKMNAEEFKTKFGIVFPELQYKGDEIAVSRNGGAKKNASQQEVTWTQDLTLSGSVECTVSPNAEWGAIQKFSTTQLNITGAISYCNYEWVLTPTPMNCPTSSTGVYRGWTSDHDYNVHISNLVTIQ